MIRFILRDEAKLLCGLKDETFRTIDLDVPELENQLLRGGYDGDCYQRTKLLAVEILPEKEESE